jgi:hypothetical protein
MPRPYQAPTQWDVEACLAAIASPRRGGGVARRRAGFKTNESLGEACFAPTTVRCEPSLGAGRGKSYRPRREIHFG